MTQLKIISAYDGNVFSWNAEEDFGEVRNFLIEIRANGDIDNGTYYIDGDVVDFDVMYELVQNLYFGQEAEQDYLAEEY